MAPRRRRRAPGALVWVGLAAPAVAMSLVALKAHDTASKAPEPPPAGVAPPGPKPVTPVLSARRTPTALADRVRVGNFVRALAPVTDAVQERACLSVAVDGTVLVADNAQAPFVPASNAKLLTAAVALDVLGADYRFTTEVRGTVGADGVVSRLVLVGGGDPVLSTPDYPKTDLNRYPPTVITDVVELADAVAASGAKRVINLVADESRYDSRRDAPGWRKMIEEFQATKLSALMINDGYVNNRRQRNDSTAMGALQVFRRLLADRGVTVDLMAEGRADSAPVLASVSSPPLSAIVGELLTTSDNNTAELLLKEVGRAATGVGSTAAGAQVVVERLNTMGVPTEGLVMADGSGLSTDSRVTCATFVGLLAKVGPSGPIFDGLPIAGKTGTLAGYLKNTPANGVLRAKTGSLSIARSLTGYYPGDDGSWIEFSFLVNGEGAKSRSEALWDDLVRAFDSYPQGPSPDGLAPLAPTG